MPSYITFDHRCDACGHVQIEMHDRAALGDGAVPDAVCEACGGPAPRIVSATTLSDNSASYVDGTRRFDDIRAYRKVEREYKKAQRQGRYSDAKELKGELGKVKASQKPESK